MPFPFENNSNSIREVTYWDMIDLVDSHNSDIRNELSQKQDISEKDQANWYLWLNSNWLAEIKIVSWTATNNIYWIMSDLHYQSDRETTLNKSPNFYI